MEIIPTEIPDVKILVPRRFEDHRGCFSETYSKRTLGKHGIHLDFVQDGYSLSSRPGVLRGLHFQIPPLAQAKLIRVARGSVFDVAVDLRRSSPTFARHVSCRLDATTWRQLLIPIGFAHGFVTLEPDTEVLYKVTDDYSPQHERGILWSDPDLAIDWPVSPHEVILSEKDANLPLFREVSELFD